jgi:hypothetical protein
VRQVIRTHVREHSNGARLCGLAEGGLLTCAADVASFVIIRRLRCGLCVHVVTAAPKGLNKL